MHPRLSFGNPDFSRYAEAFVAKGSRVETAHGLVRTLEVAIRGGRRPIVAVFDYSESIRVLTDELRQRLL